MTGRRPRERSGGSEERRAIARRAGMGRGTRNDVPTDDGVRRMNAAVREEVSATGSSDDIQGVAPILERLVPAAVAGDEEARDRLLAEIQPLVQRYCRGRLGRSEGVIGSADDVAQDVCLAVISALPNYEIKGLSFRAFVYGIAAHKVTDAFRAIGRNRSDPVADLPDAPILSEGPEQRLLAAELAERLGHLLHKLTPAPARGARAAHRGRAVGGGDGAGRRVHAGRRARHPAPGAQPAAGGHRRPARSRPRRPRRHARQRVVGGPRLAEAPTTRRRSRIPISRGCATGSG